MPSLSVRKIDKNAYQQLRMRAARHGVSIEEEARQIIYQAVSASDRISHVFQRYFGSQNGVDLYTLKERRKPHEPMDFNE